jgi:Na+/H+ antiporter NhaD/arsenite permease-like protein
MTLPLVAILVFAATYFVMAVGRLPGYRIDRAGAALLGASLMVGFGVLSLDEAYAAVDMNTITLLLGVMIVVANLRLSGFFRIATAFVTARARHPLALLAAIVAIAGLLSAFLVNDTICLVMTPLVLDLVTHLKRQPLPYLLAVAMASNAGSVATITGNPQNMIIGTFSGIPYVSFVAALAPVAAVALMLTLVLIAVLHPKEFFTRAGFEPIGEAAQPVRYHGPLVTKTLLVTLAMVVAFFAGLPVATSAILAGAVLLFTRRVKPEKVYFDIDWPLLLMFAGLFIVVAGIEKQVIGPDAVAAVDRLNLANVPVLSAVTAVLSNIVSNVPAVLVLKPFIAGFADPHRAWLIVAMASTLAGNLAIVGSVANLIVAEKARRDGVTIGFWDYFRVGAPLTILSIAFGAWWLA